jgi:hypothetical protein
MQGLFSCVRGRPPRSGNQETLRAIAFRCREALEVLVFMFVVAPPLRGAQVGFDVDGVRLSPAVSRSTLHIGDAAVRNCSGIQSGARPALNCAESSAYGTTRSRRGSRWRSHNSGATSQRASAWAAQPLVLNARPNASAQPSTRTTHWIPMLQRAANTGQGPSSACPLPAGLWRRPTERPLDFQLAVTILRTESSRRSRRSTTTDEKCHPRPNHRPAA